MCSSGATIVDAYRHHPAASPWSSADDRGAITPPSHPGVGFPPLRGRVIPTPSSRRARRCLQPFPHQWSMGQIPGRARRRYQYFRRHPALSILRLRAQDHDRDLPTDTGLMVDGYRVFPRNNLPEAIPLLAFRRSRLHLLLLQMQVADARGRIRLRPASLLRRWIIQPTRPMSPETTNPAMTIHQNQPIAVPPNQANSNDCGI
jgi:hypothetical protein